MRVARAIVGSVLAGVKPTRSIVLSDFKMPAHRSIVGAYLALQSEGEVPTVPLIAARLRKDGENERLWMEEMVGCVELQVHSVGALDSLLAQLARESRMEAIRHGAAAIAKGEVTVEEIRGHVERLSELASRGEQSRTASHVSRGLDKLFSQEVVPCVPIGMRCLDQLDVTAGQLCVVGARPGVGKTAFLGTIALNAALEGWDCLFISLEMPSLEIQQRMLSGLSRIPLSDVKTAANPEMVSWASKLASLPLFVEDGDEEPRVKMDLEGVVPLMSSFAAMSHGAGRNAVVFIDYLQFMPTRERHDRRHEAIGHIVRTIKRAAREARVPVIVAAQLSRLVEQRGKDSRPQMSDLSDSAEIEKNADKIVFIHRTDDGQCFLRVAKNRQGPVWTVQANYAADICRFEDKLV